MSDQHPYDVDHVALAEIERLREERMAQHRMLWLVLNEVGPVVIHPDAMQDYPGDDRALVVSAENPTTKAVSYSAGTAFGVEQQADGDQK